MRCVFHHHGMGGMDRQVFVAYLSASDSDSGLHDRAAYSMAEEKKFIRDSSTNIGSGADYGRDPVHGDDAAHKNVRAQLH
jgi:hypothetical protein